MLNLLPHADYNFERTDDNAVKAWPTTRPEITTGCVCETNCNNGWMSDLEGRMKSVTEGIILKNVTRRFSPADCRTIVEWAFKTTVLANHMDARNEPFFPERERFDFARHLKIPLGVHVWIARRHAAGHITGLYRSVRRLHAPSKRNADGQLVPAVSPYRFEAYTCAFSLGYLLLQVVATRWTNRKVRKRLNPPTITQDKALDDCAISIWPNGGGVDWPPRVPITNDIIDIFWDRFERFNIPQWMAG
jgi:hypothetical protein